MNIVKEKDIQQPFDKTDRRKKPADDLDMETTIADMNVDGMPWYKPEKGNGDGDPDIPTLTKKERRAMVRGALLAALPMIGVILLVMALVYGLAYLWLS